MGDWGLKISKNGTSIDVGTAEKDLLFTTKNNTVKIDPGYSIKRTADGGGAGTITHNFTYKPMFMGFYKAGGNWYADRNNFYCTTTTVVASVAAGGDYRALVFRDEIV